MKHPLGGEWMSFQSAKERLGWKLPFVFVTVITVIVLCYLIGGAIELVHRINRGIAR